ncbi:DUF1120 domain-containing protein [Enterobacter hormaechei]|uniref:DUF1120 domain-containing protein n=1 Tax=Enterobacter hormaechei TaxID=158836 RepID=UPI0019820331|nr:DUF1120 domain-containing protein [Enterobacter hormaechei]MBN4797201.1 DUF1120 domain-containing protein [Enterobacter hormaechei]MBN4821289.1 DUF1120 domain-containing protein [Enterobacter hormaechei]
MNAIFKKGVLASVLAVAASSAMAASSIDIQVTGKILPSSCTPAFISGGGIADFGTIKVASLNSTTVTPLPDVKIIPISITCEEATRIAVSFNDAHADSAPTEDVPHWSDSDFATNPEYTAGLGMYNGKKIGAYSLGMQLTKGAVTNDAGDDLYPTFSSNNGSSWGNKAGNRYLQLKTDKSEIYSFSSVLGGTPVPQTKVNFNVGVVAAINPTNDLKVSDEAKLDGLTNVELVYL